MKHTILKITSMLLSVALMLGATLMPGAAASQDTRSHEFCVETEYEDVLANENGEFVVKVSTDAGSDFIVVEKLTVDVCDDKQYNALLLRDDVSDHVKEQAGRIRASSLDDSRESSSIVLFSNLIHNETKSITPYNYGGIPMGIERFYYYNDPDETVRFSEGYNVWNTIGLITDVVFLIGSSYSLVNLFSTLQSIASVFLQLNNFASNTVFVGHGEDFAEAILEHDSVTQYTYSLQTGIPVLGLISEKITIKAGSSLRIGIHNANAGQVMIQDLNVPVAREGQYYSSPWAMTLANITNNVSLAGMYDNVSVQIDGVTIIP